MFSKLQLLISDTPELSELFLFSLFVSLLLLFAIDLQSP
jgi:hypothetical protein